MKQKKSNFKSLMHIYRTTKIPWLYLLLVTAMTFGTQILGNLAIPYSTKIDLGDMKGAGFIAGYITISILYEFFDISYDIVNGMGKITMAMRVRQRLLRKLFHLPIRFYEEENPQRFVSRVTIDSSYAYTALSSVIQLTSIFYGIFLAVKSMAAIYSGLTWLVMISVPLMILMGWIIGKLGFKMEKMLNEAYSKQTNFYAERLPNMNLIKSCATENLELEKGREINKMKEKTDIHYGFLYMLTSILNSVATVVCSYLVLWAAASMVRGGTLAMADMVNLYSYCGEVMANAAMVVTVWQVVRMSFGGSDKVAEIDAQPEENYCGGQSAPANADITFSNVSFGYAEEKPVLKNISFTIPAGKLTAVIGRNGSGKSTIVRLLERFDAPSNGIISVGGIDLQKLNLVKWRNAMGYVFQESPVVAGTIRENIAYGNDNSEETVLRAAELSEAATFIADKEEGYGTRLDPFDSGLSGGERQRLSIARALLRKPEYLILDEATSGLDSITAEKVIDNVKAELEGKTVLMVTHDRNMINRADYIIMLENGCVIEAGIGEAVRNSPAFRTFADGAEKENENGN